MIGKSPFEHYQATTSKIGNLISSRKAYLKSYKFDISTDAYFLIMSSISESSFNDLNKKPKSVSINKTN